MGDIAFEPADVRNCAFRLDALAYRLERRNDPQANQVTAPYGWLAIEELRRLAAILWQQAEGPATQ